MTTTNPQPQPQQPQPTQVVHEPKQRNGFGITAIILGALGAIFAFIPLLGMFISWPAAIVAIVMAGLAIGFALAKKANLVISILGVVFAAAALIMSIVATAATDEALSSDEAKTVANDGGDKSDTSGNNKSDKDAGTKDAGKKGAGTKDAGKKDAGKKDGKQKKGAGNKEGKQKKENRNPDFTQTAKWSDGLSAKVLSATTREADMGDIDADEGDRVVVFQVKLHNGTKKSYDADLGDVKVNYGKHGKKAEDVSAGMFEGKISAGESKTQKFEYAIPAKGDSHVNMEVDPGAFDLKSATFTGSIKPLLNK